MTESRSETTKLDQKLDNQSLMDSTQTAIRTCHVWLHNGTGTKLKVRCLFDTGCQPNLCSMDLDAVMDTAILEPIKPRYFRGAFNGGKQVNADHQISMDIHVPLSGGESFKMKDVKVMVINSRMEPFIIIGMQCISSNKIVVGSTVGFLDKHGKVRKFKDDMAIKMESKNVIKAVDAERREEGYSPYLWNYQFSHPYQQALLRVVESDGEFNYYNLDRGQTSLDMDLDDESLEWEIIPSIIKDGNLESKMPEYETRTPEEGIMVGRVKSTKPEFTQKLQNAVNKIVVGDHLTQQSKTRLQNLLLKYSECISLDPYDIGLCNKLQYRVSLTNDHPQPARLFQLPMEAKQVVHEEIVKMEKAGVIERDPSVTVITSVFIPILKGKKEDGTPQYRLVNDLRSANNCIRPENTTIPIIEELLGKAGNRKLYCTLDLRKAFWAIPLVKSQRRHFTVMDPLLNQAFVYTRIPMGSKSGSHMMQRAASNLLFEDINVENYASYVDDAIIFCDDEEEMFLMLKQILRNYCRNGFKINPGKCAFFVRETVAFGYKISLKGIQSDPSKVKAFDEIRRPVTKKDLRSAMGKFSYYRRTVPKFAEITELN